MQTLLLWAVLAQAVSPGPGLTPAPRTPHLWRDGHRSYQAWESAQLVAEPAPTGARREALLALEPGAVLVVDRPTMRVWRVRDAAALRAKVAELRPVFHDLPSGVGRFRVPLGLVCEGQRSATPWEEVFARSGACLPDFWYPPVLK